MPTPPSHPRPSALRRRLAVMRPGRATALACTVAVAVAVALDDLGPPSELQAASAAEAVAHASGDRVPAAGCGRRAAKSNAAANPHIAMLLGTRSARTEVPRSGYSRLWSASRCLSRSPRS
jgi:hypothetical protein